LIMVDCGRVVQADVGVGYNWISEAGSVRGLAKVQVQ